MLVVSSCNLPIKSLYDDIFQHPSTIYCVTEGVERSSGVISMNIITSAGSAAAAVATQVRGEKRAANIVTHQTGDTHCVGRRELGETREVAGLHRHIK